MNLMGRHVVSNKPTFLARAGILAPVPRCSNLLIQTFLVAFERSVTHSCYKGKRNQRILIST